MTAASQFDHAVSMQSIVVFGGATIILVVTTIILLFVGAPYTLIVALALNNIILMIYQSLSVNCMVKGGCEMFAWLVTIMSILVMVLIFFQLFKKTMQLRSII